MFDFDQSIDRRATGSVKWDKYADRDVIPMWVADMDFQSPWQVMQALNDRVAHGVFGYAHPDSELADTIIDYLRAEYAWQIQPEWLVWLPGLVSGIHLACRSTGNSGSSVMTTIPVYPPFLSAPKLSHRRLATLPMNFEEKRWSIDFDRLQALLIPGCALFLLCNPHNPTGRVFQVDELEKLAKICLEHKMIICSDEIHCDLLLESGCRHIPLASLSNSIADSTITLMAPSKTYNLPGLGCAFAVISNESLRRRFKRTMTGIVPHVNALGLVATRAAFAHGRPWLEALRHYLRTNRDLVYQTVNQMPGMCMAPVEATYLAWVDARSLFPRDPAGFFERAGVGLSDGKEFGWQGFVRLNFGCPRSRLKTALDRMQAAL
jgi:cystathionine beta-lyase